MLSKITSPADIKSLSNDELKVLCSEIRDKIIDTVSKNGGHLASNLGIVEATVMLHKIFDSPKDKIIFDVSHQCYAHKLITGRYGLFDTLRQTGGISGFTNINESEHDIFTFGHSGSSVSSAVGIAEACKLSGSDAYTIAVIGDASCSNGMVFEALNSIPDKNLRLIIVLNDNGMSIAKNSGKLSMHFSAVRTSRRYLRIKNSTEKALNKIPLIGKWMIKVLKSMKSLIRFVVYKDSLFQSLGIDYIGPVDGNDLEKLEAVFLEAKRRNSVSVVHMTTQKGKGYIGSQIHPENYHSVSPFDPKVGIVPSHGGFSEEFGRLICECALRDDRITAITAAMCEGTGLSAFSKAFADRFFDVSIAEEHAVTFACGLARAGMKPLIAIYSTFLQRCYDQLIHDAALQGLDIVLAIDRAGLVDGDGATHHGVLDCAMLSSVPGTTIWSPSTYDELEACFESAFITKGISAVRYPRGKALTEDAEFTDHGDFKIYDTCDNTDTVILTYGRLVSNALKAAKKAGRTRVIKLIKIHPIDITKLCEYMKDIKVIIIAEEAMQNGCLAEQYAGKLREHLNAKIVTRTLGSDFLPHGTLEHLFGLAGLTGEQLACDIMSLRK